MEFGLKQEHIELLKSIFEKYDFIEKVVIYGSRAKGNYTDRSDIDMILYGSLKDRFDLAKVKDSIEESILPYNVDIQMFQDLKNGSLKENIERVGKIFYKK